MIIDSLEKRIEANKAANKLDLGLASAMVSAYDNFTRKYPKDSIGADYLFRAADISGNALQQFQQSASAYERIIFEYPAYPKMPEALFLAGFTYQDKLNNGVKAKEYYDKLLEKYPAHDLADDAKAMISFFGKTDEQIIEEFEKKNQEKMNK